MVTFLMLWFGSGYLGVRILVFTLRYWTLDPEVPPARVANAAGAELAYQAARNAAVGGSRSLGKVLGIVVGTFLLLVWPVIIVIWFFTTSHGIGSL